MDANDVERLIESGVEDAEATVSQPRGVDDDDHLAATVVSPAFEGETLVDQHEMVYDALGEHMTTDIHALELKTYTPEEYERKWAENGDRDA
ncbi:BolA family transcriptional regulator [halophilic archaeon]|nr:BolA family transcriptional regulator [halophilic archaeon]